MRSPGGAALPGHGLIEVILGDQYRRLIRRAGQDCLVFCRVGRFVEFYGPQRVFAEQVLGLRRVYLPRAGYALAAGFPVWLAPQFAQRALRAGKAVIVVRQAPGLAPTCQLGYPAAILLPAAE